MTAAQRANHAILLTPPGVGAIAVVRVNGPGVGAFLARHFARAARPDRCVHGDLRDGNRVIDDAVVVLSDDGLTADLNVHGGPWVVESVLDLARRAGFEVVTGPDAACAPDAAVNANDAVEREVLTHLTLARTEPALRILLAQPAAWHRFVGHATRDDVERVMADEALWWLLHPPRVAIVGAANVGKSTLANQLFAQERSITADLPGTTRDWVGEMANLDGLPVMLVDTPGLRDSADPIEQVAIARSGEVIRSADATVLVLDASRPVDDEQRQLSERFPGAIRVLNKSDRAVPACDTHHADVRTVATTGAGIDDLRRMLRRRFGCDDIEPDRPRWWTARQRALLRRVVAGDGSISGVFG